MTFDKVIMNPPYSGSLHLKILDTVIRNCPKAEIVNLSPIRWLQDPLAEYKKSSDWKKFKDIRDRISELVELDSAELSSSFQAAFTFGMGIYYITPKGGAKVGVKNSILDKIVSSNSYGIPVVNVSKVTKPVFTLVTTIDGGHKERLSSQGIASDGFIRNEKWYGKYYVNGVSTNGMTLTENKARNKRSTNGNTDNWAAVMFDTAEEAQNFYDFTKLKLFQYAYKASMVDVNVQLQFLPFLGDYSKPWTDQDLYEYFSLTDEEIREIECSIK